MCSFREELTGQAALVIRIAKGALNFWSSRATSS
jgi:hypothetical protein